MRLHSFSFKSARSHDDRHVLIAPKAIMYQSEWWIHAAVKSLHEYVSLFHMCGETIIKRSSALRRCLLENSHTYNE